jgi:small subunit ribosomal protein S16
MKKFGRRHRPFYRICAMDSREPRDGRVLEVLGTYDPLVPEKDARAILNGERINYWLSKGAQPTEKVKILIKKYGASGTRLEQQRQALARLAQVRRLQRRPPAADSAGQSAEQEEASPQARAAETAQTPEG